MPHVAVKMFGGRTEEKKQELAAALRNSVSQVLGCEPGHVSVTVTDVEPEDWHLVYDQEIHAHPDLVLSPSYKPGDELK